MKLTNKLINDRYSNTTTVNQEENNMNPSNKHQYASLAAAVALSLSMITPSAEAEGYTPDFDSTELMDIISLSAGATFSDAQFSAENSNFICGQRGNGIMSVSGVLGEGDQQFNNGAFFDTLTFETVNASQFYKITVNSTAFTSQSAIVNGENDLKQVAYAGKPGEQVQYSGTLVNPGKNTIYIHAQDRQPGSGGRYTVSLECNDVSSGDNTPPGSGITGGTGTSQDPLVVDVNTPITSELLRTDQSLQDREGGQHFMKYFKPNTQSGTVDVSVSSNNFTPFIFVLDASGNVIDSKPGSLSIAYDESMTFVVLSQEANVTGSFTITMNQEGGGSSDGTGSFDQPISFSANQPLNVELTAADETLTDGNGGNYYAKVFQSDSVKGSVSLNVQASNFTPEIYVFDPATGTFERVPAGSPVNYNPSLLIIVTSDKAQATGAFNFRASTSRRGSF